MRGQIVDATLVLVPKKRHMDAEKQAIEAGKRAQDIWSS